MIRFVDGPVAGAEVDPQRAPMYLRVVVPRSAEVATGRQPVDVLDRLEDEPRDYERVLIYRRVRGTWRAGGFSCARGRGGGCHPLAESADYEHLGDVDGEALRETVPWREWAQAQPDVEA